MTDWVLRDVLGREHNDMPFACGLLRGVSELSPLKSGEIDFNDFMALCQKFGLPLLIFGLIC